MIMERAKSPQIFIIGIGPGSSNWLTDAAKKALKESDIILAWEWSLNPVKSLVEGKKIYFQDTANYLQVEKNAATDAWQTGETVAVLRVGDPCVSSSLTQLLIVFKGCDITIIPSVGSVQFSAAAARICIDESVVISFHDGRREIREEKLDFLYECFTKRQKHLIVLTDETQMPPATARYLLDRGLDENTPVVVCENLTLDDEQIFRGTLGQAATMKFGYTTVLVIRNTPLRPA